MVPAGISIMRYRNSLKQSKPLFKKRIQNLRRRKPINIWCLDRCSVKYSFPQVKLLSMLLIKRLQKSILFVLSLSPFSPLCFFPPFFMKNKSPPLVFPCEGLLFCFFSQNKGRKQGERINYSKKYLKSVRKL